MRTFDATMTAEIITIGDELLIGQVLDTNSAWIAKRLNDSGFRVVCRVSVGDTIEAISTAVDEAMARACLVVMTGGLGPTKDDITKQTLAAMFGCGMVVHAPTEERNRATILARGFDYNELNRAQALVPECCEVLMNHHGTAPGMWFERDGHVLVALPGVPFEMTRLVDDEMLPRLRKRLCVNEITHRTMVTFGIAESMLAVRIAPWEEALPEHLHLAYLPSSKGVRLRLSAYSGATAAAEIDQKFRELEAILGDSVVGYGDDVTVQEVVARVLTEREQTLATAESCTGGALAAMFTAMAGASTYFRGGVVAYSNDVKTQLLGVSAADIECESAVSQTVAEQMATGARERFATDFAIATTGLAGPDFSTTRTSDSEGSSVDTKGVAGTDGGFSTTRTSDSEDRPVAGSDGIPAGTVWVAVAHAGGVVSQRFTLGNLRAVNIERACSNAANMLRKMLL